MRKYASIPLFGSYAETIILASLTLWLPSENAFARDNRTGDPVILAIGDSLTAGYGLSAQDAFPSRLQVALAKRGRRVRIINAGVSGDTASGANARLGWALNNQVDMVIVTLGGNDALRGVEPKVTYQALDDMLRQIKSKKLPILLTGMQAPPNTGLSYAKEFNAIFPKLAKQHDVEFYPFFLSGVAARREYNQIDGIHPNLIGVNKIVENLLPYVLRGLRKVPKRD